MMLTDCFYAGLGVTEHVAITVEHDYIHPGGCWVRMATSNRHINVNMSRQQAQQLANAIDAWSELPVPQPMPVLNEDRETAKQKRRKLK